MLLDARKLIGVCSLVTVMAGTCWAGSLEQGMTAWTSGRHGDAIEQWRPLAVDGHAEAALFLGFAYRFGVGVDPDAKAAAAWYRLAAGQDVAEAQYQLGLMYELGEGVPRDQAEADYWYGQAVGQGFCPGELSEGGRLGDS